nr:MAG TPA: hypothetical protein [Caudoviricetes sp.]
MYHNHTSLFSQCINIKRYPTNKLYFTLLIK